MRSAVTPPLDDNVMLSVDEYRSKLYELAGAAKPPSRGRRHSVHAKQPSGPQPVTCTFKTAAVAAQLKPSLDKQAKARAQPPTNGDLIHRCSILKLLLIFLSSLNIYIFRVLFFYIKLVYCQH